MCVCIHVSVCTSFICVTGFAKRGLPHTSNLQASTIHNLKCVKAMDLEIVQFRLLTHRVRIGESFKLVPYIIN